jgi:hypothetical protein
VSPEKLPQTSSPEGHNRLPICNWSIDPRFQCGMPEGQPLLGPHLSWQRWNGGRQKQKPSRWGITVALHTQISWEPLETIKLVAKHTILVCTEYTEREDGKDNGGEDKHCVRVRKRKGGKYFRSPPLIYTAGAHSMKNIVQNSIRSGLCSTGAIQTRPALIIERIL